MFSIAAGLGLAGAIAAFAALVTARRSFKAERDHPLRGNVLAIGDVKLHYLDKGAGPTLVLLHGNGSMIEEFVASGLIQRAAQRYRVLAFDRPGFGHTNRPASRAWTPQEQASLIISALKDLGIGRPIILGHSWGALVALALAFEAPSFPAGLVLVSGYYFPEPRLAAFAAAAPAVPVWGAFLRWAVEPFLARALWGRIKRKIFAPAPVAESFEAFPLEMALRPSQLRANAEEAGMLDPTAEAFAGRYGELRIPVAIVAGEGDRVVDPEQSERLHGAIAGSRLRLVPAAGHMVHHTAPSEVLATIDALGPLLANDAGAERRHLPMS